MSDIGLTLRIRANADGTMSVINGVGNSVQQLDRHAQSAGQSMDRVRQEAFKLAQMVGVAFGGVWLVDKVKEAINLADSMTMLDARIRIATSGINDYRTAKAALAQVSMDTGTALTANVTLFTRMNKAVESMGGTVNTTLGLVDTLSKGLKISGASSEEASSVIRQLSQALSSGVLRGDEFNSVMENGSRVVDALVVATGKSRGALRGMAEEGKLTAKVVVDALQSQASAINDDFQKIPLTVSAAMENINTATARYIEGNNNSAGATNALAQAINNVAVNFTDYANGVLTATAATVGYFAAINIQALISFTSAQIAAAAAVRATRIAELESAAVIATARARDAAQTLANVDANVALLISNRGLIESDQLAAASALSTANARIMEAQATRAAAMANADLSRAMAAVAAAQIAQAEKAAALAGLANLGQQQAAITRNITAATTAQTEAQVASVAADAAKVASVEELDAGSSLSGKLMESLRGVMTRVAAINPFVLAATAAAAAATAAYLYRDTLVTVGDDTVTVGNLAESTWLTIRNAAVDSIDEISAKYPWLGTAASATGSFIAEVFSKAWQITKDLAELAFNGIVAVVVAMGTQIGIAAAGITEKFSQEFNRIKAMGAGLALGIESALSGDFSFSGLSAAYQQETLSFKQINADMRAGIDDAFKVDYAAAAGKLLSDFTEKVKDGAKDLHSLNTMMQSNADAGGKVTETHKAAADALDKDSKAAKKHADAIANEVAALNDQHQKLVLSERDYELSKLSALGMSDAVKASSIALWDSNQMLEAQKKGIDAGASAMDAERDRYDKLTMSAQQYLYTQLLLKGVSPGEAIETVSLAGVNDQIEAQRKAAESAREAMGEYDDLIKKVNQSTSQLGATNEAVFDGALGGINTLVGVFKNMGEALKDTTQQQELLNQAYAKEKDSVNKSGLDERQKYTFMLGKEADYLKANKKLERDKVNDALTGTRQMIGATAKMFDEKSNAAKALHGLEMGIAVAQMAMQGVQMVKDVAATAVSLAAGAAKFFAQSGWLGFAGVAAMGAVMAGLGYAAFGGGSGASSEPPKMSDDTGTVLGDSSAKSESIDRTYNLLQDIQAENYPVLKSIDQGIADLHSGITDVITRLFQAGGLATVNAPASKQTGIAGAFDSILHIAPFVWDPIMTWLLGSMFGGKKTSTVTAQGISTGATSIADVMAGKNLQAQQFAQIETKTSGGWFSNDKYSHSTQYAALDASTQKALNDVFGSMGKTMLGLADSLGSGLSDRVKNYIIPALSVDLKGLNGEDAAKKLNGVISAALDTMSTSVFGDILGQYQQLGEGLLETAVRIVSEIAVVKDALATSGLSITGDAIAISDSLAQAAGGIKEFQKQFSAYFDQFYTDAEKQSRMQSQLSGQLGDVSLSLSASRDGYRKQVEAVDLSTAAGQQQYSMLLKLSAMADTYYKGVEDAAAKAAEAAAKAAEAAAQLAKQQHTLDISLLEANGHAVAALTAKRKDEIAALDESLRATQNAIYAAQDRASALSQANRDATGAMAILQKSVAAEKTTLTNTYNASIKTTQTAIDGLNTSVQSLSTLADKLKGIVDKTAIPGNESSDRSYAQSVLSSALILYKSGGGLGDQNALSNALDVVAKPSENLFATFSDYQKDFAVTAGTIAALSDAAARTTSKATSQLDVMKTQLQITKDGYDADIKALDTQIANAQAQIDAINGTTVAVMTVADAINNLGGSLAALSARKDPIVSMYQSLLGRAPDAGGSSFWNASMESGASLSTIASGFVGSPEYSANISGSADPIAGLYQTILGRAPDAAGADFWSSSLASGTSVADIATAMMGSPEYASIKAVRGFAVGINEVPFDMTANIHQGERILPAADNRELMRRLSEPRDSHGGNGDGNMELLAEIKALRDEVKALRAAAERGNENTQRTADTLNGRQGTPFLVEIAS